MRRLLSRIRKPSSKSRPGQRIQVLKPVKGHFVDAKGKAIKAYNEVYRGIERRKGDRRIGAADRRLHLEAMEGSLGKGRPMRTREQNMILLRAAKGARALGTNRGFIPANPADIKLSSGQEGSLLINIRGLKSDYDFAIRPHSTRETPITLEQFVARRVDYRPGLGLPVLDARSTYEGRPIRVVVFYDPLKWGGFENDPNMAKFDFFYTRRMQDSPSDRRKKDRRDPSIITLKGK
jgi:hypothetical protein